MKSLILLLILTGCTSSFPGESTLNKVDGIVTKRLKNERNLSAFGIGACWPEQCEAIEYDFIYPSYGTVSSARRLLIDTVQIIVESARSVKEFEQYLANPPFTEKHIMMGIKFNEPTLKCANDPQIKLVTIMFGKIWYEIWNEEAYRYDSVHKETYAEALQLLGEGINERDPI